MSDQPKASDDVEAMCERLNSIFCKTQKDVKRRCDAVAMLRKLDADYGKECKARERLAEEYDDLLIENGQLDASVRAKDADAERYREVLGFYARGEHFNLSDESLWDTVSGEPPNWWCDEAGSATVEDGSIAKEALAGNFDAIKDAIADDSDAAIAASKRSETTAADSTTAAPAAGLEKPPS